MDLERPWGRAGGRAPAPIAGGSLLTIARLPTCTPWDPYGPVIVSMLTITLEEKPGALGPRLIPATLCYAMTGKNFASD